MDFVFLAGKNRECWVGRAKEEEEEKDTVTLTVSGDAKEMIRVSGYNANGSNDRMLGTSILNVETNLNLQYLDNVNVIRISENKTLDVSRNLSYETGNELRIDFALDEVAGANWVAMSGIG